MIVVTTPTGRIGRQVLDGVLNSGKPVRVIARDPSRLSPQVHERAEVVHGSHDDPDVLTQAFAGADCVFWLVPPDRFAGNPEGYYLGFTQPACKAIKSQRVPRVVGVSSLGHEYAKDAGLLSAALAMDRLIESTGVSYRALAMPFFMENLLGQAEAIRSQGTFFLPNAGDRTLATVATRDVATVAAALLLDDSWGGQHRVPVAGPDDLSPGGMAQIMSEVLGRPVRFQQIPIESFTTALTQHGMTDGWAQGLAGMTAAQNDGIYEAEPHTRRSATPTSFRQWCEEVLKPAVLA